MKYLEKGYTFSFFIVINSILTIKMYDGKRK